MPEPRKSQFLRVPRIIREHLPSKADAVRHGVFHSWAECIDIGLRIGLWDILIAGRVRPRLPGSKEQLQRTSIRIRPSDDTLGLVEEVLQIYGQAPTAVYRVGFHYGLCNRYSPIFSAQYRKLADEAAVPVKL